MQILRYGVRFTTPAFLGNAEQSGQWRTPPLKALLRQWWRVAYAARYGFNVDVREMRRKEGLLFGNAWIKNDFRKSAVRIRLSRWDVGKLRSWNGLEAESVFHPEVERTNRRVGPHAYLGFGPLDGSGGTAFGRKVNAAIQAGETAVLSIAVPDNDAAEVRSAVALVDAYGTAGGRSRNGWGSLSLDPLRATSPAASASPRDDGGPELRPSGVENAPCDVEKGSEDFDLKSCARPWEKALKLDWPHSIGQDGSSTARRALVWWTKQSYDDWRMLMRDLATVKIGLRTMFVFPNSVRPPHSAPLGRHWLSYPTTKHSIQGWSGKRLPNTLRFKVRPDRDQRDRLRGVIFHFPCLPPPDFRPDLAAIRSVWQNVHALLDELCLPQRSYRIIGDVDRRKALRRHLDGVTLERIPA